MTKIAFLLLLGFNMVYGQLEIRPGFSAGLSAFSENSKLFHIHTNSIYGFTVDGSFELLINNRFSLLSGIAYQPKGGILRGPVYFDNAIITYNNYHLFLHYLAIPIDAKVKLPFHNFTTYGIFGIDLGYLLSAKRTVEPESVPANYTEAMRLSGANINVMDLHSVFDMGFDLGIGIESKIGNIYPFLDCIYLGGLLKNTKSPIYYDTNPLPLVEGINSGILLKGGLRFKL